MPSRQLAKRSYLVLLSLWFFLVSEETASGWNRHGYLPMRFLALKSTDLGKS